MELKRACGTLVHPTSFPTEFGIGDLGPSARDFIHFLVDTNQSLWQILPLTPTGYGNSPYAGYSAFAGNHHLISPEVLFQKGLLTKDELASAKLPAGVKVYYEEAFRRKRTLFEKAATRFYNSDNNTLRTRFRNFKEDNTYWLDDYCLFMALFEENGLRPWNQWKEGVRKRKKRSLDQARKQLSAVVDLHYWLQFEFFEQWMDLKRFANLNDILVIGDIPIFVDHNSSDVWAHSEFFAVDENGNRTLVAGVPPDYFSETGQLWGNPLYKWSALEEDGYLWWIERFKQMLTLTDTIRLDHFRGFDAYWEIPAQEKTAQKGRWVKGPGAKLFDCVFKALKELPIIAEDLGVVTPGVVALRDRYNFPGMKILQFAFNDNAGNGFLPHNYSSPHCVVYTGTHDNDTTIGWYESGTELEKHRAREYTFTDGSAINWALIKVAMMSIGLWSVIPMQDFMNLDTKHRMNLPGTVGNNWDWRYTKDMLDAVDRERIKQLVSITNRNLRLPNQDANMVDIQTEDE